MQYLTLKRRILEKWWVFNIMLVTIWFLPTIISFFRLFIWHILFSDWLEKTLSETKPAPKLVTVVNPGNPTGTYIPEPLLKVSLSLSLSVILCLYICTSFHAYACVPFETNVALNGVDQTFRANLFSHLVSLESSNYVLSHFYIEDFRSLQRCWMLACCR
jgi:hypothetical protein